jgi:peptidoglycan/LPS O-acetylase OafA/YrhL
VFFFASLCIACSISFKVLFSNDGPSILRFLPNITRVFLDEMNSILFCLGLISSIALLGIKGYSSRFLSLIGRYSYELFLIHGAFLIKYNPVIVKTSVLAVVLSFGLFFILLLPLAYCMVRVSERLNGLAFN